MIKLHSIPHAPIAQGIEHRSPEPGAQVRILLGAPNPKRLTISSSEPFFRKGDAVNTDEKRDRELQTMERMIRIYCRSKHGTTGQMLCPDCEKNPGVCPTSHRSLSPHGNQDILRFLQNPLLRPRRTGDDEKNHAVQRSPYAPRFPLSCIASLTAVRTTSASSIVYAGSLLSYFFMLYLPLYQYIL